MDCDDFFNVSKKLVPCKDCGETPKLVIGTAFGKRSFDGFIELRRCCAGVKKNLYQADFFFFEEREEIIKRAERLVKRWNKENQLAQKKKNR